MSASALFRVSREPLDLGQVVALVAGPDRGAIAIFTGVVRDHHHGRSVRSIEYHAYPEMAEQVLRAIGEGIARRFGALHIAIHHRLGPLAIGEASVIIAVAAPHRKEALAGCAEAIERLKAEVPIWKKEFYENGSSWIEGCDADPAGA